ncbi:MAG: hypothetical protein H7X89_01020 [Rhizobiales bacterium]|nr:hypothetical protein [Hyphomicrobiales bacterium]
MKTSAIPLEAAVRGTLDRVDAPAEDRADIAWACAWLEACGYPGVKMLVEALRDERCYTPLVRDALGLDLNEVSCALLAPRLMREIAGAGRVFLRNVRHGLYLLPFTVRAGIGIGCPVDPAFAIGGERTGNPYAEKLAAAECNGIVVDDESWRLLQVA